MLLDPAGATSRHRALQKVIVPIIEIIELDKITFTHRYEYVVLFFTQRVCDLHQFRDIIPFCIGINNSLPITKLDGAGWAIDTN